MSQGGRLGQDVIDRHIRELRSIISKLINPQGKAYSTQKDRERMPVPKSEMAKEDPVQADIRMVLQKITEIKNKIRKIYNLAVEAGYGQAFEDLATANQSSELPTVENGPEVVDPRGLGSIQDEELSRGELTASDAQKLIKAASFYDMTGKHEDADDMVAFATTLIQ